MLGQVRCAELGTVAWVTLSNLAKFNAMSRGMWRELKALFVDLPSRPHLRCVVLQGEGGHFCAGGDIAEYPDFRFDEASLRDFHENDVWGGLSAILACDIPVIAAIEGNCLGAGIEMASCCDLRLASEGARFGAPIARLGFPMAPREAQLVAHAVGELTAREMLLSAAVLPAHVMQQRGFLNRVVPDVDLLAQVQALAERVSSLAPVAARAHKKTLRALGPLSPLGAAPALTAMLVQAYDYAPDAEHQEGISAFLAKRSPVFKNATP